MKTRHRTALVFLSHTLFCGPLGLVETSPLLSATPPQASAPAGRDMRHHYTADQPADILHMRLELTFTADGLRARVCEGRVEYAFRPRSQSLSSLKLEAVGMTVLEVQATGITPAPAFAYDDKVLTIQWPKPIAPDTTAKVAIRYRLNDPPKGMHFVLPSRSAPNRPTMVYTMSEPIEARYWVPAHDWPNERWTTDIVVTVPKPFSAVANGLLVEKRASTDGQSRTFHWRNEVPTDPHLMGLAVGELVELTNTWRGKPVHVFTQSGSEAAVRFTFARVPQMLDFFTGLLGVEFPYPAYHHVTVVDHHHGGMEHAGFSFVMPGVLSEGEDGQWPREQTESWLIAHMLAHQWFGGMVNYRSVSQAWLNEGFGTYLDTLWTAHTDSPDRVGWNLHRYAQTIAQHDSSERGSPLVRHDLEAVEDIYTLEANKIYHKGAWILHMLRLQLGDSLFWTAVKQYLQDHQGQSVETTDLRRAFESASGRDLEQFFQQWVYGRGIPRLEVDYAWHLEPRHVTVIVRQTQKIDAATPAFVFPLELTFRVNGEDRKETVSIREPRQEFTFPFPVEPKLFCVDPRGALLKTLKVNAPRSLLVEQARRGSTALSRLFAIEALQQQSHSDALAALGAALNDERAYWGVRAAAAAALGKMQTDEALDALLRAEAGRAVPPRVLAAVLEALGGYTVSREAHERVLRHAGPDQPLYVQRAAVAALGHLRAASDLTARSRQVLVDAAQKSTRRFVRLAALSALRTLDDPQTYEAVLALARPGQDDDLRDRAIVLLGRLGREEDRRSATRAFLTEWLSDPDRTAQVAAAQALGELKDPRAIADLERLRVSARIEAVRSGAAQAIEVIKKPDDPKRSSSALIERLAALEKQNQELERKLKVLTEKVQDLERKPASRKPTAAKKPKS